MNTHFNHPNELTPEAAAACDGCCAGIPVGNQACCCGVNDDAATLERLFRGLGPHARAPLLPAAGPAPRGHGALPRARSSAGVEIFRALRGRTSGFAIPTYVLDTPYGKVPLGYPYLQGRDGDHVVVEAWDGRVWRELNPA